MKNTDLQDYSHKRFNILTGEWVLVSPHRAKRPWQGQNEAVNNEKRPTHDESCYLCAGNTRINGEVNPNYKDVFVFTNDFAALQNDSPTFSVNDGLLVAESETGICKVICFSPDHSKSLADMSANEIQHVVFAWQREFKELAANPKINYVQIFENKGAVMGCSNPHPHGQIWSQSTLPNEVDKKNTQQLNYYNKNNSSLLGDYLTQELENQERIIFENDGFVVIIPFWAVWPFEAMIAPKRHMTNILEMTNAETLQYAEAIAVITKAYDKLFNTSFPYSSGIHQAPTDSNKNSHWHWHMSFYPPLLRSASVKKFMVGYEMFGSPQRDITAESAVKMLKELL
ncbi:UDP-glucose--hexose-1-phosphate uridylyltransferase [Algibacter amylolyticus]|uniref:Galactose-1-phosphate uridylyltransferase n=1 Tax=Algibacter amylolyticus TaxID=1608400 RepID=A0A5M7AX07_9FLAO|nr:UDP-glucose--hexose-1-phosphate uridylyltransferase [Algibacter amylolyticus]KAA5821190.1 UDP-glucose--hexose-1-phosphate uridylyltransferase [Algibacter amylolyticus]MBB5269837.1 UDPglucose--hexose-1-phosphate uridylyltransferase [Algibacter amylolyticus]TSJ72136.1 UDP-glucose--hexose-1-phosphate uridylyltransferase [Algibacter amylolyticus]